MLEETRIRKIDIETDQVIDVETDQVRLKGQRKVDIDKEGGRGQECAGREREVEGKKKGQWVGGIFVRQVNELDLTAATRPTPPAWPPPAAARLRPPRRHPAGRECPPRTPKRARSRSPACVRTRCALLVLRGADAVVSAVLLLQLFLRSVCAEDATAER